MICTVILWSNGMVTVHDENGEQIPELQGPRSIAVAALLSEDTEGITEFYMGNWNPTLDERIRISRSAFFSEAWEITKEWEEFRIKLGQIRDYTSSSVIVRRGGKSAPFKLTK